MSTEYSTCTCAQMLTPSPSPPYAHIHRCMCAHVHTQADHSFSQLTARSLDLSLLCGYKEAVTHYAFGSGTEKLIGLFLCYYMKTWQTSNWKAPKGFKGMHFGHITLTPDRLMWRNLNISPCRHAHNCCKSFSCWKRSAEFRCWRAIIMSNKQLWTVRWQ